MASNSTLVAIVGEKLYIEMIRNTVGHWVANNFKPNQILIRDRLSCFSLRAIRESFALTTSEDDQRLSHIGPKSNRFFMITAQSILNGYFRLSLKGFFVGVLQELDLAFGHLSLNSWRIMTAFTLVAMRSTEKH